jgi:hypothetical protein
MLSRLTSTLSTPFLTAFELLLGQHAGEAEELELNIKSELMLKKQALRWQLSAAAYIVMP